MTDPSLVRPEARSSHPRRLLTAPEYDEVDDAADDDDNDGAIGSQCHDRWWSRAGLGSPECGPGGESMKRADLPRPAPQGLWLRKDAT
jgi:hypothetical protein